MIYKHFILTILACVCLQVVAFGQEKFKTPNNSQTPVKENSIKENIIKPFRLLPIEEQYARSEKKLIIGNYILNFRESFKYSLENEEDGYYLESGLENVICFSYTENYKGEYRYPYSYRLDFYDEKQQNLVKSYRLEDMNPYKKESYPNIIYGVPDMEYTKRVASLSEKEMKNLDKRAVRYFTTIHTQSSQTGYIATIFELIGINQHNIIVNCEETILIYDKAGNQKNIFNISNDVWKLHVSENGKYLCVIYGGVNTEDPNNPLNAVFAIYDNETGRVIKTEIENHKFSFAGMKEIDIDLIKLDKYPNEKDESAYREEEYFDLTQRISYQKTISKKDWEQLGQKLFDIKTVISNYNFEQNKF